MSKAVPRRCRMCTKMIIGQGKHYCSPQCAGAGRAQKREEEEWARQLTEWPTYMFEQKPFACHDLDPGDGVIRRMPRPDGGRFGGGSSSAAYTEQFGSLKPF